MKKTKQKTTRKQKQHVTSLRPMAGMTAPESSNNRDTQEGGPIDETMDTGGKRSGAFTPGELGQPGPLDQEGEGNRQNDQLDELEHIEPSE